MDYGLMTMWLSMDPMADVSPNISPYHYCHWNPIRLTDPTGMLDDEWQLNVRTNELTWVSGKGGALHQTVTCICPDGSTIVHQGDGMLLRAESTWLGGNDYRVVTETGDLPQPSLFLTKMDGISTSLNLNSPMQTGSEISVPTIVPLGAGLYDGLGSSNIANQVSIRGDGTFMYARDKHNGFGKGLSWRHGTVMKNTTLGRLAYTTSRKVPALSMVTSGVEIGISWHQNGLDSRQTFKTIGGSVGGIVPSMIIGASIGGPVGFVVGFGVGIISSWLGEMGGGLFYDVTH